VRLSLTTLAFALILPCCLAAQEKPDLESRATEWLGLLRAEKFDSAASVMAPAAKEHIDAGQLRQIWPQILERYGALTRVTPSNRLQQNGFEVVQLLGYFKKGVQNIRVSFDAEGRVAGFFIAAGSGEAPADPQNRGMRSD
jgi:Protein of unknown function (DUF3887)